MHIRRVFIDGIRSTAPTQAEVVALSANGVTDPLSQRYAAWRHSLLLLAAPVTVLTGVLAVVSMSRDVETGDPFTAMGVLVQLVPFIAVLVLTATLLVALRTWSTPGTSARILMWGWAVSIVAPVVVALTPFGWIVDEDLIAFQFGPEALFNLRLLVGVGYAIQLLPAVLTFPAGVIRGSTRVKSLMPGSTIAGWFLVATAPFYSLFFLVAFVLISQLVGNALLVLGVALVIASPWIHARRADLYTRPLRTTAETDELGASQRTAALVALAGWGVIGLWALTAEVQGLRVVGAGDNALLDPWNAVLRGVEFLVRLLTATAVFTHLFLRASVNHWRREREYLAEPSTQGHHNQMAWFELLMTERRENGGPQGGPR